jgi:TRAP-type C4-dicarboxylate transport system substrate-binding protein
MVAPGQQGIVGKQAALAVAAVLVLAATACGGSGTDKAGGRKSSTEPLVLSLAVHDPGWGAAEFAEAVEERSDGSIEIHAETPPWMDAIDWESRTVEHVRTGRIELAVVGARVWDTLGVEGFQALQAPFLVDSLALEQRVLEGSLAAPMLESVEQADVVGVALLPGPMRRPFGHSRPLVSLDDYTGRTIGVVSGEVEKATFRALGARTREYESLHPSFFVGAALDPSSMVEGGYEGKSLVTNVVLWPRAETIVMNATAFGELTSAQQKTLLEAGRAAVQPRIRRIESSEQEAVRAICTRDLVALVPASPDDVEALRDAVRPVYSELERTGETRDLITEIGGLGAGARTEPLRCPAPEASVASELDGRWQATPTRAELLAAGALPREVPSALTGLEVKFAGGRWVADGLTARRQWTGTYTVNGDVIRLTIETCSHNPCTPGAAAEHGWSVYRDVLSLTRLPGRSSWPLVTAEPFRRIR